MKKNRQTHYGIGLFRAGIPVLLSGMMLVSCQNKLHEAYESTDGLLRFVVSDSIQWQQGQVASSESRFGGDTSVAAKAIKVNGTVEEGRQMYLVASVKEDIDATNSAFKESSGVATKGTMITGSDAASFHQSFGILAQSYGTTVPETFTPNYMDRVAVTRNSNTYSTANKYYIPTGQTVKMFAYAPYDATSLAASANNGTDGGLTIIETSTSGRPTYSFTTPLWLADQDDLCFAEDLSVTSSDAQATLTFGHAMAAIRFLVSSTVENCKINSISLNNIYSKATLSPTTESGVGWWTYPDPATTTTFTYDNGGQGITHNSGTTTDIFGEGKAMFMIPHPLDNASVSINVTVGDGSTQKTLTASLTDSWVKGNTYTYTLSFSAAPDVNFNVSLTSNSTVPATGGDFTFSVTSEQNNTFVPYKVQYQSGSDWYDLNLSELKTILSSESTNGTGTTRTHSFHTEEVFTISSTQNLQLKDATSKGTESNPYGLANGNSANCYIVSAPGWYSIPLVYGNALKDDAMNNNVSGKYQTHAYGGNITTPWIKDIAAPTSAQVLWQDVQGLVRNVQLMNNQYLKFYVDQATIAEGNAVIGCFHQSGTLPETLLWSWHIWVTPGVNLVTVTTNPNYGSSVQMMDVPLGYVHGGRATWQSGDVTIRFIPQNPEDGNQYLENLAQEFTLTKEDAEQDTPGRLVTYQWGRKDPMRPITTGETGTISDCPVYPSPGGREDYLPKNGTINSSNILDWIHNPHLFHTSGNAISAYLWNSNLSSTVTTSTLASMSKGLYDPCPYMYAVPAGGTFDDLANASGLEAEASPANGTGGYGKGDGAFDLWNTGSSQETNHGEGYAIFNIQSGTWRLPLLGGRPANNFTNDTYGDHAFYWQCGKKEGTTGYCFGMYLPYDEEYEPWIDLIGLSGESSSAYANFTINAARNAYAIIPAYNAFINP